MPRHQLLTRNVEFAMLFSNRPIPAESEVCTTRSLEVLKDSQLSQEAKRSCKAGSLLAGTLGKFRPCSQQFLGSKACAVPYNFPEK